MREEEKEAIMKDENEVFSDIRLIPPKIKFEYSDYVSIDNLLNDAMYFEMEPIKSQTLTIIVSDGLEYLPVKTRNLVGDNGWRCFLIRSISNQADEYVEYISLAIFYGKTGKFFVKGNGTFEPCGLSSEIFISFISNKDSARSSYKAKFNGHDIDIAGTKNFSCSLTASPQRLGKIDYIDERGIDFLYQCLFHQKHW